MATAVGGNNLLLSNASPKELPLLTSASTSSTERRSAFVRVSRAVTERARASGSPAASMPPKFRKNIISSSVEIWLNREYDKRECMRGSLRETSCSPLACNSLKSAARSSVSMLRSIFFPVESRRVTRKVLMSFSSYGAQHLLKRGESPYGLDDAVFKHGEHAGSTRFFLQSFRRSILGDLFAQGRRDRQYFVDTETTLVAVFAFCRHFGAIKRNGAPGGLRGNNLLCLEILEDSIKISMHLKLGDFFLREGVFFSFAVELTHETLREHHGERRGE